MKSFVYAFLVAALAGCATPAERAAQAQRDVEEMMMTYGPACERLGYKAESDSWRDCVLRLNTKDAYERSRSYPWMTQCFGSRGFYQCSTF